jgi:hypothetical protein
VAAREGRSSSVATARRLNQAGPPSGGPRLYRAGLLLAVSLVMLLGCAKAPWVDRTVISEDVNGVWLGFMAGPDGQPMANGQVRLELQQRASRVTGSVYASSSWLGSGGQPSLPIEGSLADDVFTFKDERSILIGELTVSGDEMTGRGFVGRRPVTFTLRRIEMASSAALCQELFSRPGHEETRCPT